MSVEVGLEVVGVEELKAKLERLDSSLKRKVSEKLAKIGNLIKERARQLAPVRTGRLRASIYSQLVNWTLTMGASAPYARYLEFGTRWIRPRHFLLNAIGENLVKIDGAIRAAVYSAVSEAKT